MYALQLPKDDGNGFMIQPLICKPYTNCKANQYMKENGRRVHSSQRVQVKSAWQCRLRKHAA